MLFMHLVIVVAISLPDFPTQRTSLAPSSSDLDTSHHATKRLRCSSACPRPSPNTTFETFSPGRRWRNLSNRFYVICEVPANNGRVLSTPRLYPFPRNAAVGAVPTCDAPSKSYPQPYTDSRPPYFKTFPQIRRRRPSIIRWSAYPVCSSPSFHRAALGALRTYSV